MKAKPLHLARRFATSLLPASTSETDLDWVRQVLSGREWEAFERMTPGDKAHAVAVGRAVEANLDRLQGCSSEADDTSWVLKAAILHDIGKSAVRLGTYGRVAATMSRWVGGADMAEHWAQGSGITRRIGLYLMYPRLGADILEMAGSDRRVIDWSVQHHLDESEWSVPVEVGRLLVLADDGKL